MSLTTTRSGSHLLVVNSDFDLQFAQGTIQSLNLARIRELSLEACSEDGDCSGGQVCDTSPTEENDGSPSFTCVGASGRPCGDAGEKSEGDRALSPGRCAPINLRSPHDGGPSVIVDVAETSAFATQGLLLERPCLAEGQLVSCPDDADASERVGYSGETTTSERLFVPVRGDTTVHYLDVRDDGRFICGRALERSNDELQGAPSEARRCSTSYRISEGQTFGLSEGGRLTTTGRPPDPSVEENEKPEQGDPVAAFRLPPEPLDLAASHDGRVIVVTHQLDGYASTLLNSWTRGPKLIHIAEGLAENPIGVAALPASDAAVAGGQAGFLLTYRSVARVDLLRFIDDGLLDAVHPEGPSEELVEAGERVFRPQLVDVASSPITLNSAGFDSRGLVVDDRRRREAMEACGDTDCQMTAERVPLDVYVTNRTPNSLLVGRTAGEDVDAQVSALPSFYDNIPLTAGPSRVVLGHVTGPDGEKEPRVFVLCFDSGLVYIYDPVRRVVESEIRTGRGPYTMAFDSESALAFIGHFTDSYIGVVSLDQRHPMTFGSTLATLGDPTPPRASQ